MQVVSAEDIGRAEMDNPSMNSEEEEYMRMRYFEMMRRQAYEEQMRQQHMIDYRYSESNSRGQPFKTPNAIQFNYDDMYSYGSEMNTASANYRPGNTGTALRRKAPQKSNISG